MTLTFRDACNGRSVLYLAAYFKVYFVENDNVFITMYKCGKTKCFPETLFKIFDSRINKYSKLWLMQRPLTA